MVFMEEVNVRLLHEMGLIGSTNNCVFFLVDENPCKNFQTDPKVSVGTK